MFESCRVHYHHVPMPRAKCRQANQYSKATAESLWLFIFEVTKNSNEKLYA